MLVLFDNNVPRGLRRALVGHVVIEARERGWAAAKNGVLLQFAEDAGFEVLVTSDKNIQYQQNLAGRRIALVVLSLGRWRPVRGKLAEIAAAGHGATPGSYVEVLVPPESSHGEFAEPFDP